MKIAELEDLGNEAAVCTIIRTAGSTPCKSGSKMVVSNDGSIWGTIGGGTLEHKVIKDAISVIHKKKSAVFKHALVHDLGMCCGGTLEIFIEPIVKRKKLYIFGAGHIGAALAKYACGLDFKTTLIDDRHEIVSKLDLKDVEIIEKKHRRAFKDLHFDKETFVAVVTHNHKYDREIVAFCSGNPNAYLGMIGSKRKIEVAKKTFIAGNIMTESKMKSIDWPMGIKIKAETPDEIAISIIAKMIDVRSKLKLHGHQ